MLPKVNGVNWFPGRRWVPRHLPLSAWVQDARLALVFQIAAGWGLGALGTFALGTGKAVNTASKGGVTAPER